MFNQRHLTMEEKVLVRAIVRDAGVIELLTLVGQMIGSDHPDFAAGEHYRGRLLRVARDLERE